MVHAFPTKHSKSDTEADPKAEKIRVQIYKSMTPAQKWAEVEKLWQTARALKRAGIRSMHPDWTDAQVEVKLKEVFLYATT